MLFLKAIIYTTLAMLVTVFAFFFFTFDSQYQLNNALDQFLKGQQEQALDSLGYLEREVRPSRISLYKAYVLREQGRLKEANQELQKALNAAQRSSQADIYYEVCLNRAYNAFLQNDLDAFELYLQEARLKEPDSRLTTFFNGLASYLRQDYATALESWMKAPSFDYLSRWMEHAFSEQFSDDWRAMSLAHCYIEQGQFLVGRELLEKRHESLSGENRIESAFLIGLSYATEAREKPLAAAMPYYQVAQSYFDQLPIQHESFALQKQRLGQQLSQAAAIFITERDFENVSFFVNILEHWKANEALNEISKAILNYLEDQIAQQSWDEIEKIASVLNKVLKDGYIRQSVSARFEGFVNDLLKKGDFEQLASCWQVSLLLSANPADLIEETSAQIASQVLQELENDNQNLDKTAPYLSYWSSVERDGQKRFLFARQLLLLAANWWQEKGHEGKALNLMKLAQRVPFVTERDKIQALIEQELKNIYLIAAQEDNIEKLSYLHDAARFFKIESFGKQEKTEISSQLEDAIYLNRMGRLLEAQKRLEWIVKVDPKNQEATRLLAQVFYRQNKYGKALSYFEKLEEKDKEAQELAAVCQLFGDQREKGQRQLEKLARQKPLLDSSYLQLTYLYLAKGDGKKAQDWLSQMTQMNAEAKALSAVAAFNAKDYQLSIDRFHQLPASYSQDASLQVIGMRSFVELSRIDAAEVLLKELLLGKETSEALPSRFRELMDNHYQKPELLEFAGDFYQEQKAAFETALSYYRQIEKSTTNLDLKKARALIALNRHKQAAFLLKPLATKNTEAAVLLAELQLAQYRFNEAGKIYHSLSKQGVLDEKAQLKAAQAAIALRKWKVAAEHLTLLEKMRDFSDDERLLQLQVLVMAENKALVSRKLSAWDITSFSTQNKLKLLHLALKIGVSHIFKLVWDDLAEPEKMSLAEKQELLSLYLEMGKYRHARQLSVKIRDEIQNDVYGQMLLANLSRHLLDQKSSMQMARKAFEVQPFDLEVIDFLSAYETDQDQLQAYTSRFERQMQAHEGHFFSQLGYLLMKHASIKRQQIQSEATTEENIVQLKSLRKTLQELGDLEKNEPEVFALLGSVLVDLKDYQAAEHALNWAIQLSPSMVKAHRSLAKLNMEQNQMELAKQALEKALRYERNDLGLWIELSDVYRKLGNYEKARTCLEQARYFSLRDSRVHRILTNILLDIGSFQGKETAEQFNRNQEAIDSLLGLL